MATALDFMTKTQKLLSDVNRAVSRLEVGRGRMAAGTYGYDWFKTDTAIVAAALGIVEELEGVLAGTQGPALVDFMKIRFGIDKTLAETRAAMTALGDALGAFNTRIIAQLGAIRSAGGMIEGETLQAAKTSGARDLVGIAPRLFTAAQTANLRGDIDAIVAARDAFLPAP